MPRVPQIVRDAIDRQYQDAMRRIESQKSWVNNHRESLAESERELANLEKNANDLADWLRNNTATP